MEIPSGTELHGEETESINFMYQPEKYKEGE
jgi:hypothetical protein